MSRPRALEPAEEAALIVMKRGGAADKDIMARFDIGRQTIYDILGRGQSCTETVSVHLCDSSKPQITPLVGSTAA